MPTPRILVVEDNPITRKLVRVTLQGAGFEVDEAWDGATAIACVAAACPDVVIQDLCLPDLDGIELARRLRERIADEIPIIAFSGHAALIDVAQRSAGSFTDALLKPVEPSRLVDLVNRYVAAADRAKPPAIAGKRALVVEDDPLQRKLLRLHLAGLGLVVDTAADGVEGLAIAREQRPDVIVSDVLMPRLDGFGLCVAVRRDPALRSIPFVLISSICLDPSDADRGRDAGADAYLARTPDLENLLAIVPDLLGRPSAAGTRTPPEEAPETTHDLVRQLERQAAMNSRLSRLCTVQAAHLAAFTGISDELGRMMDADLGLSEILARCLDAIGISRGALYLAGPDGRFLRAFLGYGKDEAEELETFFDHLELLHSLIAAGAPVMIPSDAVPEAAAQVIVDRSGGRPLLVIPIVPRAMRLGALVMQWPTERFSDSDWPAFVRTVAAQIGWAVALGRAFSRLRASDERYRGLFEAARDAMILADDRGRIIEANQSACALTGYAVADISGLAVDALVSRLEIAGAAGAARAADDIRHDYLLTRRDGVQRQVEMSVSRTRPGLKLHLLNDVTEERKLRAWVSQTEKLAAMGQLLAGVAHELNNPLTVIQGQTLLLKRSAHDPDVCRRADQIAAAGDRCARIVKNFLALARQRQPERELVAVNTLVTETVELLAYALRVDDVQVITDLDPKCRPLWGDTHQLQQVVVNLITNAHHALRAINDRRWIRITSRWDEAAQTTTLDVVDNGPGIPDAIRDRIFEPFFTTKAPGEGTGLGLSLCVATVHDHDGTISVDGEPGQGACFHVTLPLGSSAQPEQREAPAADPAAVRRAILVVDDEPEVATTFGDLLAADGYVTEVVTSGAAALEALQREPRDAILTDMRMPGIDGRHFYEEVARRWPDQVARIVFITGDTLNRDTAQFLEKTRAPHVSKPLVLDDVRRALRACCEASPTNPAVA